MTAQEIATLAHKGQFRRDGVTPYIVHPAAVAAHFLPHSLYAEVAWLHDVLEDTDWSEESLLMNHIHSHVVDAVKILTHKKGESYKDYIERINRGQGVSGVIACRVKLADIAANLGDAPTKKQVKKYAAALSQLVSI